MPGEKKVVIIDYGMGNLFSVLQACAWVGLNAEVTSEKQALLAADALILPGVGAFNEAMLTLKKLDLIEPIRDKVAANTPLLGVCLGQQLLFSESEEFGSAKGLDFLSGSVRKFPASFNGRRVRIPQIAWNKIHQCNNSWKNTPFEELNDAEYMYFVHSYYVIPENGSIAHSQTHYEGTTYCSSVLSKNIFATQFHPEKSALKGLTIYKNWALQNGGI